MKTPFSYVEVAANFHDQHADIRSTYLVVLLRKIGYAMSTIRTLKPTFSRSQERLHWEVDLRLNSNLSFDGLPEKLKHGSERKQRLKELASSLPGPGHACPYDEHPQIHQ